LREQAVAVANPPLGLLAPARMIDFRVHVGIETVFARVLPIPGCDRLLLDQAYAHDGLDALEPILPWHHEPDGRSVLIWQRLAIEANCQDRERVHCLVEPQAFDVGPFERL